MKKTFLFLGLIVSSIAFTSCFNRQCVCKTKIDGEKVAKTIVYKSDKDKESCENSESKLGGVEVVCK